MTTQERGRRRHAHLLAEAFAQLIDTELAPFRH